MNNELIVKLGMDKLTDDLKKSVLTPKEKAELIKDIKQITGMKHEEIGATIGVSAGKISEYLQLQRTSYSSITDMKRHSYNVNFYKMIEEMSRYAFKHKDIPLNTQQKTRIKILIERLRCLIGEGL